MTWHKVVPGAAVLVLAIGCGDDGSSSTPTGGPTDTGTLTTGPDGSTGEDPTTGASSDPGTTTTVDPGTTSEATSADETGSESSGEVVDCEYPAGAVEPMALGEVLFPYSWPVALHGDGTEAALELEDAPCGLDEVIEWSPHDVLVFVSIPAW